jgi:hypothetical protein
VGRDVSLEVLLENLAAAEAVQVEVLRRQAEAALLAGAPEDAVTALQDAIALRAGAAEFDIVVVEGMAQTAGLLVADAIEFNRRVVLAKVAAAEFHFDAVPGDTIRFQAEILDLKPGGSLTKVVSTVDGRVQGEAELFFAHLEPGEGVPKLFEPDELLKWLDQMHIYEVGRDEAGNPLSRPDW